MSSYGNAGNGEYMSSGAGNMNTLNTGYTNTYHNLQSSQVSSHANQISTTLLPSVPIVTTTTY